MIFNEIQQRLDEYLEVEFSFYHTDKVSHLIAKLTPQQVKFVLSWVKRVSSTNIEIAYQFALQADNALEKLGPELLEAWLLHAMDTYDAKGLQAAIKAINNMDKFARFGRQRKYAVSFDDKEIMLNYFVSGLSGRPLKLKKSEDHHAYTDTETIFLPEVVAIFDSQQDNFKLLKAMLIHAWAQLRFGSLNLNIEEIINSYKDSEKALNGLHLLERLRLDALIKRTLPGIYKDMMFLSKLADDKAYFLDDDIVHALKSPTASINTSTDLLKKIYPGHQIIQVCYQGILKPAMINHVRLARIKKDKELLKVALGELAQEQLDKETLSNEANFEAEVSDPEKLKIELKLNGESLNIPENTSEVLSSILLDFGQIPDDYLIIGGAGNFDIQKLESQPDTTDVWGGTYHEQGAHHYNEWDYRRKHYKKNWTVLRELEVKPIELDFYTNTIQRYQGLILSLRRTFEMLRGENKLLKAQNFGDDIDIDALVQAQSDFLSGLEMTDRLFTYRQKEERNIAVMFMVDMSGSTRGWINDAEREALILLAESLEVLGDRYAIYGFSGWARKRCEAYKIKDFLDNYDENVKRKICAIEAKDYTRMGVAIRHLSGKLDKIDAKVKLLITLSDGKPDDYGMEYRGQYGIEDTKMALLESRQKGIHAYCITIDQEGKDYLPHMYGAANYTVLDEVSKLPLKISDIYRRITT